MGAKVGSEKLGKLYNGKRVRKRREWRGVIDTLYDFNCWLKIMWMLAKFIVKPNNLKGFLDTDGC